MSGSPDVPDVPYPKVEVINVGVQEDGFIGVDIERQFGTARFSLRKRDAEELRDELDSAIGKWERGDFA